MFSIFKDINKWFAKIEGVNLKVLTWITNIACVIFAIMLVVGFAMGGNWKLLVNGIVCLILFIVLKKVVFWFIER